MLRKSLFLVAIGSVHIICDTFINGSKSPEVSVVSGYTFNWYLGSSQTADSENKIRESQLEETTSNYPPCPPCPDITTNCAWKYGSEHSWVIRNPKTGFVLDVQDSKPVFNNFTGAHSQIWKVKPVENWQYLIISHEGKVLEIEDETDEKSMVILGDLHTTNGDRKQRWIINADNTITTAISNNVLDIYKGEIHPGKLMVHDKHGGWNQLFVFEYKFFHDL